MKWATTTLVRATPGVKTRLRGLPVSGASATVAEHGALQLGVGVVGLFARRGEALVDVLFRGERA